MNRRGFLASLASSATALVAVTPFVRVLVGQPAKPPRMVHFDGPNGERKSYAFDETKMFPRCQICESTEPFRPATRIGHVCGECRRLLVVTCGYRAMRAEDAMAVRAERAL